MRVVLLLVCILLSGCEQESQSPSVQVVSYPYYELPEVESSVDVIQINTNLWGNDE